MSAYRDALADLLEWAAWHCGHPGPAAVSRARALLAEAQPVSTPEPVREGPTYRDVLALRDQLDDKGLGTVDLVAFARAVLARWGRPAPEPVSVAERLPTAADCDADGRCWWFTPPACGPHKIRPCWTLDSGFMEGDTHWLPHWALPVPQEQADV
jgi:hypothetical protein